MENQKTISILINDKTVTLSSDLPDLNNLVETIVDCRDTIDVNKIKVECDDNKFDKVGFEKVIKESVKDFLKRIVMDDKAFKEAFELLEKNP